MTAEDAKPLLGADRPVQDVEWNAVYADQLPRLYNYFRFRVPAAEVEELTARTFEKAWKHRAQYRRDVAAFSSWLYGIARNVVTDHLRAEMLRRRAASLSDAIEQPTPQDRALQTSDMARLATLTRDLPDRHRELIALKYGAALNNRQIARITGLSESNVGTTLQRIVARLRAQW